MSRLPVQLPNDAAPAPRRPLREACFFLASFAAVFLAALLVMDLLPG